MPENSQIDREHSRMELLELHNEAGALVKSRLKEFGELWKRATEEELFAELCFCLLTPQSKAGPCWQAVVGLRASGLLLSGTADQLSGELCSARFRHTKAQNIVLARELFSRGGSLALREQLQSFASPVEARAWLVEHVRGMGWKEASHFLRNIGKGGRLAILDRHILRNLLRLGVLLELPKSLSKKRYFEIEKELLSFSDELGVPPDELDMLLWYREAGEVFK